MGISAWLAALVFPALAWLAVVNSGWGLARVLRTVEPMDLASFLEQYSQDLQVSLWTYQKHLFRWKNFMDPKKRVRHGPSFSSTCQK